MAIYIDPTTVTNMLQQAESQYPLESCGLIIGSEQDNGGAVGAYYHPCQNTKRQNMQRRFLISPEIYQEVEDSADDAGLAIISIVHSHPDHPDQPSEFDRLHAWPGVSYIIISVLKGHVNGYRSWRLSDDRQRFDQETICVEGETHERDH